MVFCEILLYDIQMKDLCEKKSLELRCASNHCIHSYSLHSPLTFITEQDSHQHYISTHIHLFSQLVLEGNLSSRPPFPYLSFFEVSYWLVKNGQGEGLLQVLIQHSHRNIERCTLVACTGNPLVYSCSSHDEIVLITPT